MAFKGAFRFHAVGQGLFYSGLLTDTDRRRRELYSFVYDCGTISSKRYLRREIDDFKPLLQRSRQGGGRSLDLLVISHMHDDHVNGLEYLLEDLEVDTVVMPYADEAIRLLALAESSDEYSFLRSFYSNPIAWLSSRGVNRIMLIGSDPEGHLDAKSQNYNGEEHPLHIDRSHVLSTGQVLSTELVYLGNDVPVSLYSSEWEFRFQNLKLPCGGHYRQIVDDFKRDNRLSLDDIFRSRALTRELAGELRKALPGGKTVNRTSVVMAHGPSPHKKQAAALYTSYQEDYHRSAYYFGEEASPSTVLTGDIEIKTEYEAELLQNQKGYSGAVVFQYPHHGARDALHGMPVYCGMFTVFSAGLTNRYNHPHQEALFGKSRPIVVDERNAWDYRIVPHVYE